MTRIRVLTLAMIAMLMCTFAAAQQGQSADKSRAVGKWELDLGKSKFGQLPQPKAQTIEVKKVDDNELEWTATTTTPDGQTVTESWSGKTDGSMQALKEGQNAQASYQWHGDKLIGNMTGDQGIKVREEIEISPDNNSMIIDRNTKGPNGDLSVMAVYNRK